MSNTCPPLGTGSVDMSALSESLAKKGTDPVKAVEDATTRLRKVKEAPVKPKAVKPADATPAPAASAPDSDGGK